jgi:hypothetical protein
MQIKEDKNGSEKKNEIEKGERCFICWQDIDFNRFSMV